MNWSTKWEQVSSCGRGSLPHIVGEYRALIGEDSDGVAWYCKVSQTYDADFNIKDKLRVYFAPESEQSFIYYRDDGYEPDYDNMSYSEFVSTIKAEREAERKHFFGKLVRYKDIDGVIDQFVSEHGLTN